jgi:peptide/nickel transport system ATP-binding protein/oligopeptide transport system ATP-binding protein
LLKTMPRLRGARAAKLDVIEGQPPIIKAQPAACAFRARCPEAMERCGRENPQRLGIGPGHDVACFWDVNTGKERHA